MDGPKGSTRQKLQLASGLAQHGAYLIAVRNTTLDLQDNVVGKALCPMSHLGSIPRCA